MDSDSFAFEVRKTGSSINVELRSHVLILYLGLLLGGTKSDPRRAFPDVIDGFFLLKNIDFLRSRCPKPRAEMERSLPADLFFIEQLEAEWSLLVEGLVADDQFFESFGYENLYEKGVLTYDRWKSFQSSQTSRTIDQLDRVAHSIDQFEDDEDFNKTGSDDFPELLQASHSMRSVPSLRNNSPQYEIRVPVNDGKSSLIAAIYAGRNDVIAELLARGANPMILSHIKQEDQWLVAQSLLDNGVNATSLFESTHDFKHVGPRLLYVLMEKGAEIYPSWPASTQGCLTHAFGVSDHEIQEANLMRAHNLQLRSAIQRGDIRCAEEQISHGADPTFGIDSALVGDRW